MDGLSDVKSGIGEMFAWQGESDLARNLPPFLGKLTFETASEDWGGIYYLRSEKDICFLCTCKKYDLFNLKYGLTSEPGSSGVRFIAERN